ncbi:hypothetical protein CEE44_00145 [Candidatus Woesearchaeota archaeon B3_Woes]|nr:MAG: hypothetical protein CEE44_00145 [Candidatus Woesearchaeota archaeon B3_Woes]
MRYYYFRNIILFFVLVVVFVSMAKQQEISEEEVGEGINFQKYLDDPWDYHNQKVAVFGFLGYKFYSGSYHKLIIDESGNEIELTKVDPEYRFVSEGVTDRLYLVEGIFKRGQEFISIDVLGIFPVRGYIRSNK